MTTKFSEALQNHFALENPHVFRFLLDLNCEANGASKLWKYIIKLNLFNLK